MHLTRSTVLSGFAKSRMTTFKQQLIVIGAVLGFFTLAFPPSALSAEPELSLIHSENNATLNIVPDLERASLVFHYSGKLAATYDIDLGAFLSTSKLQAVVTIDAEGEANTSNTAQLEFAANEHRKILALNTTGLVAGVKYSGFVTASAVGKAPQTWAVNLEKPKPIAELSADVDRAELDIAYNPITRLFLGQPEPIEFLITLTEKSRDIPVAGLTVRRAAGSELHKNFDLENDLQYYLDGVEVTDMSVWNADIPPDQVLLRNIPAGEQRALKVSINDLPRGEHKLVMQIDAVNAKPGSAPTVELDVRVSHGVGMPAAVLLLAIAVSYLLTKGTVNWRQRRKLQQMARTLDRAWLQEIRDKTTVVWLRATRRQTLITLDRFPLLPAPEGLVEKLENSIRLLGLLRRYMTLRDEIGARVSQYMLKFRIENALDRIVDNIEPEQLNAANEAALITEFDALEKSLDNPSGRYRPYVEQAQNKVRSMAVVNKLSTIEPVKLAKIEKLWADHVIGDIDDNATIETLVQVDRVCAAMRVLKRHIDFGDDKVLRDLSDIIAQDNPDDIEITAMFGITNQAVWEKIVAATENKQVKISPCEGATSATTKYALAPITFDVSFDDPVLDDLFMTKHRMRADWSFKLTPEPSLLPWKKTPKPIPWDTKSVGKQLLQFAPNSGELEAKVELRFGNQSSNEIDGKLSIDGPQGSFLSRIFVIQEFVLLLVSIVIALASGLVLYYVSNSSFGSIQDYLALFTWGVGVDQGKNLAQTFQSLSSQAKDGD